MSSRGDAHPGLLRREAALTGEGTLLLIIACFVMIFFGWLAWRGSAATDAEARAYTERTLHQLLVAHDAAYLNANLSPRAKSGLSLAERGYIMASLTNLGVPSAPPKIEGDFTYGTQPGEQSPIGRFAARVTYPAADAHFDLIVARRQGLWRIDYFTATWQNTDAPGSAGTP